MKKRALSICLCLGITMVLFAGCGSADQKKAARENTEAVQETGTEALSKLMDNTEEATEVAEVTETTEASETSDPAASVDASATSAEASTSGNDAAASGSTAKADTKKETKSGSKSDSGSASQASASQPAASGSGSAKADNTAAPAQQTTSAQPASQPQSAQPAHEHQWEQYVKDTINHPEVGHYETKVVQAAYDEPQYDWHYICNKCGLDMGTDDWNVINHGDVCDGSYRSDLVQVGTIHHDAVTEQVYVVDQAAWTEQVYGYRCSCGATK